MQIKQSPVMVSSVPVYHVYGQPNWCYAFSLVNKYTGPLYPPFLLSTSVIKHAKYLPYLLQKKGHWN